MDSAKLFNLQDELARMRKEIGKLEAEKLLQRDEVCAFKVEVRSYQDELALMRKEIGKLEAEKLLQRDEVCAFKVEVRSCQDELARMRKEIEKLEAEKLLQRDEVRAFKVEVRSNQDELARISNEIEKLEVEKLLQCNEIRALKASEACSYHDEVSSLNLKIQSLEEQARSYRDVVSSLELKVKSLEEQALQETPARNIGREVRLRYLERHRQRMGRRIGKVGHDRIKCGDRAAHRGRPVVDALLCLTGHVTDREVYPDLYGVRPEIVKLWKDVPEMIDVTGFRASLQSEGRLTEKFQTSFQRLLEVATPYLSPTELIAAFGENMILQRLHVQMQDCYDKIVAANPRCSPR